MSWTVNPYNCLPETELRAEISGLTSLSPSVSAVVPALNEPMLGKTACSLLETLPNDAEIIVFDDGSTDGCTDSLPDSDRIRVVRGGGFGVAGARNQGAAEARGQILCFCDAHITAAPGWWEPMADALSKPGVAAVGPEIVAMGRPDCAGYGMRWTGSGLGVDWLPRMGSAAYPVPLLGGACIAVHHNLFKTLGGFDSGMFGWGSEDMEFSLRCWLMGYELQIVPQAGIQHLFRDTPPYKMDWFPVVHNLLRTAYAHFSEERLARVLESLHNISAFPQAAARCASGDIWTRRANLARKRKRTDDWFFASFGINC
jgi:glycosyltransferase involved in cell wall biosynthesis